MTPAEREARAALLHLHAWLEVHDARTRPLEAGGPRRGYIGLDHAVGENEDGCTACRAVAVLEGRLEPLGPDDLFAAVIDERPPT